MDLLKSVVSPLVGSGGAIPDTLKLVVIGGTVETARRMSASAWNGFVDSFFLTAHFSQDDHPHDWLMHWLSKQPAWSRSREFDISTRSADKMGGGGSGLLDEEDEEESMVQGRKKRRVQFTPSMDTTHTIYYRGHWLRITRTKRYQEYGSCSELKISVVARSNDILKKLVLEAKRMYEKDAEHKVHIFMADVSWGGWRYSGSRQKRPMSSIVLEPGVKEMILADCKDFLLSEDWYAERGIPFRRGYLLHGVPGSGKTSLIHSLAGELGLDIYVISLSAKGMSDNTLASLMGNVPTRCILLLEDLDAAFTRSVSRDANSTGAPTSTVATAEPKPAESDGSTLSLSGLLNSLDGVAAAEGRLLFATTNHIERLDPALSRPGRMDVWVNFKHATKWQAEGIFKCFFPFKPTAAPATPTSITVDSSSSSEDTDASQRNLPGSQKESAHAIPLLTEEEVCELAKRFGQSIPEDEFSVASLQGYLLKNKTRPRESVEEVEAWIKTERETRAKIKKEKEEAEAKEKKEAEEKEKKEKEEKEKEEKAEKETKEAEEKAAKEKEKAEKKERPKHKKIRASGSTDTTAPKAEESKPAPPPAPVAEPTKSDTETAVPTSPSSSEDESSTATGVEGDTEGSVTSEEENPSKAPSIAPSTNGKSSNKWVAVKGQPAPPSVASVEGEHSA